jgi:hypothetical protein
MLSPDQAFQAGLDRVRDAGIPAKGHDVAVLAAHRVFVANCEGKTVDPRFDEQAPGYAMTLILRAYAAGGGGE